MVPSQCCSLQLLAGCPQGWRVPQQDSNASGCEKVRGGELRRGPVHLPVGLGRSIWLGGRRLQRLDDAVTDELAIVQHLHTHARFSKRFAKLNVGSLQFSCCSSGIITFDNAYAQHTKASMHVDQ